MKKTGRNYVLKKNKSRRPFPKTRKHKNTKVKRTLKGGNPLVGPMLGIAAGLSIAGLFLHIVTNKKGPKEGSSQTPKYVWTEDPSKVLGRHQLPQ